MGAELCHQDGLLHPDLTNPIVDFRNFANVHKNCDAGELRVPAAFGA